MRCTVASGLGSAYNARMAVAHDTDVETEKDTDETESETKPRNTKIYRASASPKVAFNVFGAIPETTTHWGICRRTVAGRWERLTHPNDADMLLQAWPLEELTEETIRDRWGSGTFRTQWEGTTERGGRAHLAIGRVVTFQDKRPAAEQPAAAGAPAAPTGDMAGTLSFAMQLIGMADQRASQQVESIVRLAGLGDPNRVQAPTIDPALANQISKLMADVAAQRAEMEAAERRRTLEAAHRRELEHRDEEIRRLERRLDDELNQVEGPSIQAPAGAGMLEQIGYGMAGALMKNPETAMKLLSVFAPPQMQQQLQQAGVVQPTMPHPPMHPTVMGPPQQAPTPVRIVRQPPRAAAPAPANAVEAVSANMPGARPIGGE